MSIEKVLILLFGIVFLITGVGAFGVTSVCSDRTPCEMHPGEERTFDFLLQSGAGGDTKVRFEILDDAGGIAQIVGDNEFIVPAGSQNVNAKLKVKIPEDVQVGIINIIIKFTEIPSDEGQVTLSPSFTLAFPLTIISLVEGASKNVEESGGKVFSLMIIAVLLVFFVLIAITSIIIKNKKRAIV